MGRSGVAGRVLGGVLAAALWVQCPAARAWDAGEPIREAAYRLYEAELLQLARGNALDNDAESYRQAEEVYRRLRSAAIRWFPHSGGWDWELHLSAQLDGAWSAPGCKLMVGDALVQRHRDNDAAIAFVIGHEIAHCVMEHSAALIDAAVDRDPRLARQPARELLRMIDGDIAMVLRLAPVSRALEDEADRLGMMLAAAAGYDPVRMLAYFRGESDAQGLLAGTHGAQASRIAALEGLSGVANELYRQSRR
jgi:Zn-dependent protease with chaperone function